MENLLQTLPEEQRRQIRDIQSRTHFEEDDVVRMLVGLGLEAFLTSGSDVVTPLPLDSFDVVVNG